MLNLISSIRVFSITGKVEKIESQEIKSNASMDYKTVTDQVQLYRVNYYTL